MAEGNGTVLGRRAALAALGVTGLAGCATYGGTTPDSPAPAAKGPLGPATDVPVGGGKVYPAQLVVVTQPTAGTFEAFSAVCTHLHCTVGDVSGGTINCPCHGSRFRIADGSVANGPAADPLPKKNVTVTGGQLTLD